ncbi:MAG: hypothetical protein ACI9ST_001355, partial [Psychrobacter glaciei]
MNRNYKVIWNESLRCFMAVAEYAKSRGKSSNGAVSSGASPSTGAMAGGVRLVKLSALCVGMAATGFSMQAAAGYEAGGGTTRVNCTRDSNGGFSGEEASIALGNGQPGNVACASGPESIAIGANLAATGSQATAIGSDIIASGDLSVIIGQNFNSNPTTSTGAGGVAIGSGLSGALDSPIANGIGSVAIGSSGSATTNGLNGAIASGNHALALMSGANASATNSIALGTSATANIANSVALGSGSTTAAYVRTQTGTVNGKTYTYAGTPATSSTMSIGASGTERTLTNLAAGRVSATSTDGINGSQLFQTNTELGNLAANTASALGGGSTAGTTAGGVTAPSYTIAKTDGTNYGAANNVGTALSNLNTEVVKPITFAGNSGSSTRKLGETLTISGGLAGASSNSNIKTVVTGNTVDIQLANAPVFTGQVKANGFDASNAKIINVAKGTNATDAVNFSQLAESELTSSVVAGNNTSVSSATTGNNTAYTVNAKKSTVSAGSTAVAVTPGTETNDTTNYAVDLSAATKTSLGKADTAVQTISSNDSNLTAVKTGNNVVFDFADAPVFTGQVKANGFDASNSKITNVANGTVAGDAVNFGQLETTNTNVSNAQASANSAQTSANNAQTTATNAQTAAGNAQTTATTALTEANKGFNIKAGSSAIDNVKLGETVGFTNTDSNLVVTNNGTDNTVNYNLAQNIDLGLNGSVTTGDTVVNNAGVSFTNGLGVPVGPSVTAAGFNAGNTQLTNVASGGDVTDAANATNGVNAGDVNTAIDGVTAAGLNFAGDSGTNVNRPLGSILNITGGETDPANLTTGNIGVVANGTDGLSIQLAKNLTGLTSVAADTLTAGNTTINTTGVTIANGANPVTLTNTGLNNGNNKITNVANGTIAANSKDAINGGQV